MSNIDYQNGFIAGFVSGGDIAKQELISGGMLITAGVLTPQAVLMFNFNTKAEVQENA